MKHLLSLTVFSLLATLTLSAANKSQLATTAADTRPTVLALGDSITYT